MPTLQQDEVDNDAMSYMIDLFEVRRANEADATDEHVVRTGT